MKISFNSSTLSETLFKEFRLPSLTAEQKKISLIVSGIFVALLATCYMIKSLCGKVKLVNKPETKVVNPEVVVQKPVLDVNIQDAPKDLLDKLSPQLKEQFDEARRLSSTGMVEISRKFKLDDLAVSIEVIIKRTKNNIPEGVAICGGSFYSDTAVVQITPENDQVLKAIAAHFKNQTRPRWGMEPHDMPLFSQVEINGKTLKM